MNNEKNIIHYQLSIIHFKNLSQNFRAWCFHFRTGKISSLKIYKIWRMQL